MNKRYVVSKLMAFTLCAYVLSLLIVSAALATNSDVQPDRAESHSNNFKDDFTGSGLRPELNVRNEDADRWMLVQDDYLLLIPTQAKSDTVEVNRFEYVGSLPRDYNLILKVKGGPGRNVNVVLSIEKDKSNAILIKSTGVSETYHRVYFEKIVDGRTSEYSLDIDEIKENADYCLEINKQNVEYTGFFSRDCQTWSKVGLHAFLRLDGSPSFGSFVKGGPEKPTKIDYFEIQTSRSPDLVK